MKKMTSEIALCRDHWKYRRKILLPHIAHLRCRKSRCIAIGILTLGPADANWYVSLLATGWLFPFTCFSKCTWQD
jgi:hypothetical protein